MKGKKLIISLVIGLAISGAGLYFSFRNVQFGPLMEYIASINYWWTLPALVMGMGSFFLRAWRWQVIMGSVERISFWEAYHPMMIGFMMNCILPGRVGELARPAILKRQKGVPFFQTLATVAAERAFDLIILLGLFAIVTSYVQIDPNLEVVVDQYTISGQVLQRAATAMTRLSLVLITGIILVSFEFTRGLMERVILASPLALFFLSLNTQEKIRKAVCQPIVAIMNGIAQGFAAIKNFGKVALCLGISVVIWVLLASTYFVMVQGCPGISMSPLELTAMMVIICFAISLPSAPGFWGLWEAGGIFAMVLFGVARDEAAGFTLVNHVIQLMVPIAMGLVSVVMTGVSIRQISSASTELADKDTQTTER
ncbi:MAG: flippase-like domain-containing protein [Desulfatibacillum sp.]|nr:flippase-like domain-containing protein [Desulfatibacillum sp.]